MDETKDVKSMPMKSFNNIHLINSPPPGVSLLEQDNVRREFQTLYKHCKQLHLPGPGRKIRLGTLSEYRSNENSAVRDEEEGMFRVTLDFPEPTTVSRDRLKRLTFNTANFDEGSHTENLRIASFYLGKTSGCVQSRETVEVLRRTVTHVTFSGSIDLIAEGADAFVLCLSTSKNSGSVIQDNEYNSVWKIEEDRLWDFAKSMADHLVNIPREEAFSADTLGPLNAPGFSQPILDDKAVYCFSYEIEEVEYQDREIKSSPEVTEEIIGKVNMSFNNSASIKPKAFESEKEVRIILRPTAIDVTNGRAYLLPYYLKPVLVPFDPFLEFVEICE